MLGAIGLILPPLTGIAPWLALAAAIGFEALQIGATRVHLSRGDHHIAVARQEPWAVPMGSGISCP